MGIIAKYKFNNTLADLLPEFNSEFTSDLYTVTDEVNGEVTTRTIESNSLPTLMMFGVDTSDIPTNRELSLLEILELDTTELTSCNRMFIACNNVKSINTEDWTLEKVTNMDYMFYNCINLTSLDVSNFDTSNVINMEAMFYNCANLTSLDVSNFNTSKVTRMNYMFYYCINLTSLDVSNFNTSNVTNMNSMFGHCQSLTSLDVSNWDTSNVTNMNSMFTSCYKLATLDISNFDTSNVNNMGDMFFNCNKLTSLDISNFDTSNVADMINMFSNTPLLADIGVLYMDKSSLQKLVNAMPTDSNKTLWYKDVDIDGITHGNNIRLKKYIEENVEIVLNSPLLEGDTIEVKDGKLCHYHKMGMVVLDGSEDNNITWWAMYPLKEEYSNVAGFYIGLGKNIVKDGISGISDRFKTLESDIPGVLNTNEEGYVTSGNKEGGTDYHKITINKSKLSTADVNGFKQWLQTNPTTVVYELASPYYEDITPLQSSLALRTFEECNIQIITVLPIKTKITYRTNITSAIVMEQELDTLDSGVSLSNLIEEEVDE